MQAVTINSEFSLPHLMTLSLFSSFAHQTARESAEIARPCDIHQSVVVVICKYRYPANKPPPPFLGGVITGFYSIACYYHGTKIIA